MHYSTFLTTVLIVTADVVRADWLDDKDVPSQCTGVCQPVVQASEHCQNQFKNNDDQKNCICTTADLNSVIPNCEICIRNASGNDDKIRDLRQDCGLPSPTGKVTGTGTSTSTSTSTSTGSARSTPSVTASTARATVTWDGSTTASQSEATVTPTTGSEGEQSSSTSDSGDSNGDTESENGAGSNTASMAAAGAMAAGAMLMAIF